MAQAWDAFQNGQKAKALDFALVISGWPRIYTVSKSYILGSTGDLSNTSGNGFDSVTAPWASIPRFSCAAVKGRPEDGSSTFGCVETSVLDRISSGKREISELCARQSFLDDAISHPRSSLVFAVESNAPDLVIRSKEPFAEGGGIAFLGRECVKYETAETYVDAEVFHRLHGCTRGYRLTSPTRHAAGAPVYPFMPTLFWRQAYIYKGYQDLPLSSWRRAFGGVIGGISRIGPCVTIATYDTMWLAYANGQQALLGPPGLPTFQDGFGTSSGVFRPAKTAENADTDGSELDYKIELEDTDFLSNGHYALKLGDNWLGVKGLA